MEIRAGELCEAIEAGDIMRAFAKLDEETVKRPHPCTGRLPLHYCVAKQSKERRSSGRRFALRLRRVCSIARVLKR